MSAEPEIITVRNVPFTLRDGLTMEAVKALPNGKPHRPWHRHRVIGDLFISDDPFEAILALASREENLQACRSCGSLRTKASF